MGFALAMSSCAGCGRIFGYNPVHVPSVLIHGSREPVCEDCVHRANPERIRNGLAPIIPHRDAYEPVDESEL